MLIPVLPTYTYTANAVTFDGSNDFLSKASNLTGAADTDFFTMSFWMNRGSFASTEQIYYTTGTSGIIIQCNSGVLRLIAQKSGTILEFTCPVSTDSAWHHYFIAIDMSDTGKRYVYRDGSALTLTISTNSLASIDFSSSTGHYIGADNAGSSKLNASLAEVWIGHGQFIDPTITGNIGKFYSGLGKPRNLGATGSTPSGTAPLIFLSGETVDWHTNKGTGGGFTENGALTTASTSPSD